MATPMQILGSSPLQIATNNTAQPNGSAVILGPFQNVSGQTLGGSTAADLRLVFTMAAAPTAGTAIVLYILNALDPTQNANYEDGSGLGPVIPTKTPAGVVALDSSQTSYSRGCTVLLPPGYFKVLVWNNNTGQSLAANWNAYLAPWTIGF